jgi:hypothetical protein
MIDRESPKGNDVDQVFMVGKRGQTTFSCPRGQAGIAGKRGLSSWADGDLRRLVD